MADNYERYLKRKIYYTKNGDMVVTITHKRKNSEEKQIIEYNDYDDYDDYEKDNHKHRKFHTEKKEYNKRTHSNKKHKKSKDSNKKKHHNYKKKDKDITLNKHVSKPIKYKSFFVTEGYDSPDEKTFKKSYQDSTDE